MAAMLLYKFNLVYRNPWGQALRKLHFKWENC